MIGFGALGGYLAPTFVVFTTLRFLVGIGTAGIMMCSFVLTSEVVGPSVRGFCGNLFQVRNNMAAIYCYFYVANPKKMNFQVAFSVGIMAYAGLAYFIQTDWRMLSLACSLVGLPIIVAITVFIPESPRWLYANGKSEDGLKVLKRLATTRSEKGLEIKISVSPAEGGQCGEMIHMLRVKPLLVVIQVFSWLEHRCI